MEYVRNLENRQSGGQVSVAGNKRSSPDSPPACSSSHCAKVRARELSPGNSSALSFLYCVTTVFYSLAETFWSGT